MFLFDLNFKTTQDQGYLDFCESISYEEFHLYFLKAKIQFTENHDQFPLKIKCLNSVLKEKCPRKKQRVQSSNINCQQCFHSTKTTYFVLLFGKQS